MADSRAHSGGPDRRSWAVRWPAAFGHFWWEFLVGDTPELFVGVVAVVGAVALICVHPGARRLAALVLPLMVIAVLGASVWRVARRRSG